MVINLITINSKYNILNAEISVGNKINDECDDDGRLRI
jgi:hypothetical protein